MNLEEKVAPRHAALLVIDVQNAYCHVDGDLARRGGDISTVDAAVSNIRALIAGARRVGVPVIHVRNAHEPCTESEVWAAARPGKSRKQSAFVGSWGAEFYGVEPAPDEPIVNKHRYSGFSGTRLDAILRTWKRASVVVTGVATNVCVESTARDAVFHDYYLVFMSDATATSDGPAAHQATLDNVRKHFGVVASTEEVLKAWSLLPVVPREESLASIV